MNKSNKQKRLTLAEITKQLNIDQFTRVCFLVDEKFGKGKRFDVISINPFRNDKDEDRILVKILVENWTEVKEVDILERT